TPRRRQPRRTKNWAMSVTSGSSESFDPRSTGANAGGAPSALITTEARRRPHHARHPPPVSPVRRELGEAEAAVLSDLARHELAEVVHVELEQIREEGLLGCGCPADPDVHCPLHL